MQGAADANSNIHEATNINHCTPSVECQDSILQSDCDIEEHRITFVSTADNDENCPGNPPIPALRKSQMNSLNTPQNDSSQSSNNVIKNL